MRSLGRLVTWPTSNVDLLLVLLLFTVRGPKNANACMEILSNYKADIHPYGATVQLRLYIFVELEVFGQMGVCYSRPSNGFICLRTVSLFACRQRLLRP